MMAMDAKTADLMGSQKILVIDDEHYTRKVIRALLMSIGVKKIQEACDGHAGLDAICTAVPDIVLVDWEMPGLDEPPFDNDLGRKVYDNVSQEAWRMWMEHCKMLLNEYRLNPARREDQEVIVRQMEQYFFGEGAAPPPDYIAPDAKH